MTSTKKFNINIGKHDEYVYLIQLKDFATSNLSIYKLGQTTLLKTRFKAYQKHSTIFMVHKVKNCHQVEKEMIKAFHKNFTHKSKYGKEYFEGELSDMISCADQIIEQMDQRLDDGDIQTILEKNYGNDYNICLDQENIGYGSDSEIDEDDGECSDNDDDSDPEENIMIRRNHNVFMCDDCNGSFTTKQNLIYHKKHNVCHKPIGHICKYCGKAFSSSSSLSRHKSKACKMRFQQLDENPEPKIVPKQENKLPTCKCECNDKDCVYKKLFEIQMTLARM